MFELFLDEVNAVLKVKVVVVFDDDKEEERTHRRIGSRNMNIKTSSLCRRLGLVIYLHN